MNSLDEVLGLGLIGAIVSSVYVRICLILKLELIGNDRMFGILCVQSYVNASYSTFAPS